MATPDQRSSRQVLKEFDDSIFKPRLDNKLELPSDQEIVYEEVQPFDQLWIWILVSFEFAVMVITFLIVGLPLWTSAFGLLAMTLTMALLGSLKLYSRIDATGVHYCMIPFHFKERTVPWEEMDQIQVRQYSAIKEYGGWGIRYGRSGRAVNVGGQYGIQIVKKDGKHLLIGTQRPEEAARHLARHPLLV